MSLSGQLVPFSPVEGISAPPPPQTAVATFTDPGVTNATYLADITWGDGSQNLNVTPLPANGGGFQVPGSHTYSDEMGGLTFNVLIKKFVPGNPPVSLSLSQGLTVADANLHSSSASIPNQAEGTQFSGLVARFTDDNPTAPLSDFSTGTGGATINWGDGTVSAGTVSQPSGTGGGFDVNGTHTYAAKGNFTISVQINDKGGSITTVTDMVTVIRPLTDPITTTASQVPNQVEGAAFANVTVATFVDANVGSTHTAMISWGDGSPNTAGTVTEPAAGNGFMGQVTGGHTYTKEGQFQITVSVTDNLVPSNTDGDFKTVTVNDAPLVNVINDVQPNNNNNPLPLTVNNLLTATFSDQAGPEPANNYTATINWGDGNIGAGQVTLDANNVTFSVRGSHVYKIPGNNYTITTTIMDNGGSQATTPAANPVFVGSQVERFIEQAYLDLLGRDVDVAPNGGALAFWRNYLTSPSAPPNARGLMVLAIEGTPEYRGKLIDSYFFTYLKRHADGNAISIFSNYLAAGGTFEGIKGIIIGSDEYFAKRANNNPNAFINVLFLDTLGRPADPAAQQNLFSYAAGGAAKRTFLAQAVITTPEGLAYIVKGYFNNQALQPLPPLGAYLHRQADQGAINFYVSILQRGVRDELVIADIVGSLEYFNRV